MESKFVGSVIDFLNAPKLGLVYVKENFLLLESSIPEYKKTYFGDNFKRIIQKNEYNEYIINTEDEGHFEFNYIIMYTNLDDPIGFTNLNQTINTGKYKVETLQILFDFTEINNKYLVSFDLINYNLHKNNLSNTHKNLFLNNNRSNKALKKIDINKLAPNPSPFTNNLYSLIRNENLVYRYSGNLSKGFYNMVSNEWIINKNDLENLVDFFDIEFNDEKKKVLICLNKTTNSLTYYINGEYKKTINLGFKPILIGNNFIVSKNNNRLNLYSTKEILLSNSLNEINDTLVSTLLESDKVVIDPIEKDIMIYTMSEFDDKGDIPKSQKLKKIYDDLKIIRVNYELMYATNGILVWYNPNERKTNIQTFYQTKPYTINGGKIIEVVFLTKDLFTYRLEDDPNKTLYLFEISTNLQDNKHEGKEYTLGSNNKYRWLDRLSKNRIRNVQQVNLLNISDNGCLWVAEKIDSNETLQYKLTRL